MTRSRLSTLPALALLAGLAFGSASPSYAQPPEGAAGQPADPFLPTEQESFLLQEPTTPEEFFRAAVQAQRLARPNLARGYLRGFLAANPDDDLLLRLRDEYGPAVFSRLANQKELQPLSTQLADRVADVFRRRGADPQRIEALIDALDGPPNEAYPAQEALVNAGEAVMPYLIRRLSQADETTERHLLDVLAAMGEHALPALHAALEAPDDVLKVQVLPVIARIGSRRSVPQLYFPAYGPEQAVAVRSAARSALADIARASRVATDVTDPADVAARLADEAVATLSAPVTPPDAAAEPANGVRVWSWDPQAGTVRATELDGRAAALFQGTHFARQAFRLAPSRPETQSLYLAFLLGSEAIQVGAAVPPAGPGTAFNNALAAGPDTAADILRQALRYNIPRAGVAALAVLAQTGSSTVLYGEDDVLGEALNASDPRVQLAAAVTVLSLNPDPDRPFRHAPRVVQILARALSDSPDPTAVIIDPSVQRGSTISGFVHELGYEVAYTRSGQQGFAAAAGQVQPAFVLVNLNVSQWPLSQTLANLRADARTREVPVVVYGPAAGEWLERPVVGSSRSTLLNGPGGSNDPRSAVRRYLSQTPGAAYVVETTTSNAFAAQMLPVLAKLIADPLTPSERTEARAVAAFRLAQIADTGKTRLFPLQPAQSALIGAISDPALAENALLALAAVPTEAAQRAIAEFVIAPASEPALRVTAARQLADHVRRFGILVPRATVADLYRLWENETDPALRTALSTWGGTLRPGKERVRYQLESVAPSPPPAVPAPPAPDSP